MYVIISKVNGFCSGVKRAMELAMLSSRLDGFNVYMYGILIHNSFVVDSFIRNGIELFKNVKKIGIVIIRAHGVTTKVKIGLMISGHKLIDATCFKVKKIQRVVEYKSGHKKNIIVIGNKNHPEVCSIVGHNRYHVIVLSTNACLENLEIFYNTFFVLQTTESVLGLKKIKSLFLKNNLKKNIFNTICVSSIKRQTSLDIFVETMKLLIVIGGKNSSNTKKLKEIGSKSKKNVIYAERHFEIVFYNYISFYSKIGITSGASAPKYVLNKLHRCIENITSN